jgi:hypothetical protein
MRSMARTACLAFAVWNQVKPEKEGDEMISITHPELLMEYDESDATMDQTKDMQHSVVVKKKEFRDRADMQTCIQDKAFLFVLVARGTAGHFLFVFGSAVAPRDKRCRHPPLSFSCTRMSLSRHCVNFRPVSPAAGHPGQGVAGHPRQDGPAGGPWRRGRPRRAPLFSLGVLWTRTPG